MRTRSAQLSLTLVCLIFGALLMIQFRTQGRIAKAQLADSSADQATIIASLYDANVELRREAEKLLAQRDDFQRSLDQSDLDHMVSELNKLRVFNCQSEVTGPGLELRIATEIRPEYAQDLINELRNAGAEALAVNGLRITVNSAVTAYQGQVVINGTLVEAPVVVQAIGSPDTLDRALDRKGGMISYLRNTYPGVEITLTKQAAVTLPVYEGTLKLQYAQPVK
jgi:uncharacterized protein YlxW (UPF0749 family)